MRLRPPLIFAAFASIVIIIALAAGFFIVGSPTEARLLRLDRQRLDAVQSLSRFIGQYHQLHGKLPASLDQLSLDSNIIASVRIDDPESGKQFGYRATGKDKYELCAEFSRTSGQEIAAAWRHGPGRHCFSLEASRNPSGSTSWQR